MRKRLERLLNCRAEIGWLRATRALFPRILLAVFFLIPPAVVRADADNDNDDAEYPFQFRDGLIWLTVQVRESPAPLNFLLDSGAGVSVLNASTTERLHLKRGLRVSVQGVGGRTTGYWPEHISATGASPPLPKDLLSVDLGELSRACACRIDGLLGADFFRGRPVEIDFRAKKIRLLRTVKTDTNQTILPLEVRGRTFVVPIRVNGGDRRLARLDTGCATALHWVQAGIHSESSENQIAVALTRVALPVAETSLQLGDKRFDGVPTALHDGEIFPGEDGLLGNGILARFNSVIIDAPGRRLILGKAP